MVKLTIPIPGFPIGIAFDPTWFKWLWNKRPDWMRKRQQGILIIGAGGTGKSTLGRLLACESDLFGSPAGKYRESIYLERISLEDDPKVEIVIAPGQKLRRSVSWDEIGRDIREDLYRGIVLVGSHGYHSFNQNWQDHICYQENDTSKQFLDRLIKSGKDDELEVIRQLCSLLKQRRSIKKLWLITAVTKQDLWWDKSEDFKQFYEQGEYHEELTKLLAAVDKHRIQHEYAYMSLVIQSFKANNAVLRKNLAGYDQPQQLQSIRGLQKTIGELIGWELKE